MGGNFISIILSGIVSVIITLLTGHVAFLQENKKQKRLELKAVQLKYFNPLRLYLVENEMRLKQILERIDKSEDSTCSDLLYIEAPNELALKDIDWYCGYGCYLISSCYFTVCLFSCLNNVRNAIPFLRLSNNEDTRLIELITNICICFSINNIYYALQFSMGNDIFDYKEGIVKSYREFCELLKDKYNSIWFYKLILYYLSIGHGNSLNTVKRTINAIEELNVFIENCINGSSSFKSRERSELIRHSFRI